MVILGYKKIHPQRVAMKKKDKKAKREIILPVAVFVYYLYHGFPPGSWSSWDKDKLKSIIKRLKEWLGE